MGLGRSSIFSAYSFAGLGGKRSDFLDLLGIHAPFRVQHGMPCTQKFRHPHKGPFPPASQYESADSRFVTAGPVELRQGRSRMCYRRLASAIKRGGAQTIPKRRAKTISLKDPLSVRSRGNPFGDSCENSLTTCSCICPRRHPTCRMFDTFFTAF